MFSATGNILSGSLHRPDMYTICQKKTETGLVGPVQYYNTETVNSTPNKLGFVPILSTPTGLSRSVLGVIHTVVHIAAAIFNAKNRRHHLAEAHIGALNAARGLVEAVPILGNALVITMDYKRAKRFRLEAEKEMSKPENENSVALFAYGKMLGKLSLADYEAKVKTLPKKPSQSAIINLLKQSK